MRLMGSLLYTVEYLSTKRRPMLRSTGNDRELVRPIPELSREEKHPMMNRAVARPRSLRPFRFSWLDFKVGVRMLARYPGLTLVGTMAIAVIRA